MTKWYYIADLLPNNNDVVYIRLANNEYNPDLCTYHTSTQIFSSNSSGANIPFNTVLKWSYP
jgi:hypothetical protein